MQKIKEDMSKEKPTIFYSAYLYGTEHLGDFETLKMLVDALKKDHFANQVIVTLTTPWTSADVDLEEFAILVDTKPCWSFYPGKPAGHYEWCTYE